MIDQNQAILSYAASMYKRKPFERELKKETLCFLVLPYERNNCFSIFYSILVWQKILPQINDEHEGTGGGITTA